MIEFYGGYQVYSESGIDLTLLRENLKHTPTERLRSCGIPPNEVVHALLHGQILP
jgi:hypothetical protein